jgi:3-oxoacyl-[acyl-carrier-protein] synthase II
MTREIYCARAVIAADFDLGPLLSPLLSPEPLSELAALVRRYRSSRSAVVVGTLRSWIHNAAAELPPPPRRGIVLGTAAGAGADITEFLVQTVRLGDHLVNPALFPMTVHNAVSGNAAIAAQCQGPNVVVSAGDRSAWSALDAARDLLLDGSADIVFVGGFESQPSRTGTPGTVAVITAVSTDPAAVGRYRLEPPSVQRTTAPRPGARPNDPDPPAEVEADRASLAALVAFAENFAPQLATTGDRAGQRAGAR